MELQQLEERFRQVDKHFQITIKDIINESTGFILINKGSERYLQDVHNPVNKINISKDMYRLIKTSGADILIRFSK